jgi:beta-lactamase superfamily II metal-dependent hydrolase
MMNRIVTSILCITFSLIATAQEYLPQWQEGMLDFHSIATGQGESTFIKMPDGTTMLVDAGDVGELWTKVHLPDSSRTPGEWIAHYVRHFNSAAEEPSRIDYFLLSHFHSDHMGSHKKNGSGYFDVLETISFSNVIDRGWPDYEFPYIGMLDNSMMKNYRAFLKDRQDNHALPTTLFEVGTETQFVLKKSPEEYPTFRISNIYCNGTIWDRETNTTRFMYPSDASKDALSNENLHSTVVNVVYGKFGYHCGGDLLNNWGIETAVAQEIGQTDVYSCDHHANGTMAPAAIAATTPQVFIIPVWDYYHPQPEPLSNMLDTDIYKDDRLVFDAGMVESNRVRLLDDGQQIKPDGHVVVRVYEGGDEFQVYVLNDRNNKYDVIYKTDRLTSK